MPIIAGSTLGELSRNSLLDEERKTAEWRDALDRVERARAFNRLSAGQQSAREMAMADLAMRREAAMAPWDRGMTPAEMARNELAREELGQRMTVARMPWDLGTTPAQQAANELAKEQLRAESGWRNRAIENQRYLGDLQNQLGFFQVIANEPLIRGQAEYYRRGGQTPYQLRLDEIENKREQDRLSNSAYAAAVKANELLDGYVASEGIPQVTKSLDAGGWLPGSGYIGSNARALAPGIVKGSFMLGGEDQSKDATAARARQLFVNQLLPDYVRRVNEGLGESSLLVQFDEGKGRFVPNPRFIVGETAPSGPLAPPSTNSLTQTNQPAIPKIVARVGNDGRFTVLR